MKSLQDRKNSETVSKRLNKAVVAIVSVAFSLLLILMLITYVIVPIFVKTH